MRGETRRRAVKHARDTAEKVMVLGFTEGLLLQGHS